MVERAETFRKGRTQGFAEVARGFAEGGEGRWGRQAERVRVALWMGLRVVCVTVAPLGLGACAARGAEYDDAPWADAHGNELWPLRGLKAAARPNDKRVKRVREDE